MSRSLWLWGLGCCCDDPDEDKDLVITTNGKTLRIVDAYTLEQEFEYDFVDHPLYGGGMPFEEAWNGSTINNAYWKWWIKDCQCDKWGAVYVSYLGITDTDTGHLITGQPFTARRNVFGVFRVSKRKPTQEELDNGAEPGKRWRLDWITDVGANWGNSGFGGASFYDAWFNLDPTNRTGTIRIDKDDNIFLDHNFVQEDYMTGGYQPQTFDDYWLTRLDRDGNIVQQYSRANTSINYPAINTTPAQSSATGYYFQAGLSEFDLDNRGNIIIHANNLFYGDGFRSPNVWPIMMLSYDGEFWNRGTGQINVSGPVGSPTYSNAIIPYGHVAYLDKQTDVLYAFRQIFLRSGAFTIGEAYKRVAEDGLLVWRKYQYFGNSTVNPSLFGYWYGQTDPPRAVELEYTVIELTEGLPCDQRPLKADAWDGRVAVITRGPATITAYRNTPPPFLPRHQAAAALQVLVGNTLKPDIGWDSGQIGGDPAFVGDAQLTGKYHSLIQSIGGGLFTSDRVQIVNTCWNRSNGDLYILWNSNVEISDEEQNPNRPPRINHRLYRVDRFTLEVRAKGLQLGQTENYIGGLSEKGYPENGNGRSWGLCFYRPAENPNSPHYVELNEGPFSQPPEL